MQVSVFRNSI